MVKTLDKYTEKEQRAMVGMWCDVHIKDTTRLDVIGAVDGDHVFLDGPKTNHLYNVERISATHVVPRFDLPRAWTMGGKPYVR